MAQVCTTLGMLTGEQAQQLAGAGLTAYNHNLDTSPEYYSTITSSRKYQVRLWKQEIPCTEGCSACAHPWHPLPLHDEGLGKRLQPAASPPQPLKSMQAMMRPMLSMVMRLLMPLQRPEQTELSETDSPPATSRQQLRYPCGRCLVRQQPLPSPSMAHGTLHRLASRWLSSAQLTPCVMGRTGWTPWKL